MPFLLCAHLIDIEIMLCDSFESGTLKKYRGGDTAVIFSVSAVAITVSVELPQ